MGVTNMYKVTNTLTSAYGPQDMDLRPKQGPDMPRVSVNNRKLTNVPIGTGEHIMGIRKNPEDDFSDPTLAGDAMEKPITRPLRYTPGLKCDAHLESFRPDRHPNPAEDPWYASRLPVINPFSGTKNAQRV